MIKATLLGLSLLAPLGNIMALDTAQDFKQLISKDQIQSRIREIARQIEQDYEGKEITLVMVLKGAVCLTADLIREINLPCTLEFVKASSYGQNGEIAGALTLKGVEDLSPKDKHVIIVDDIFDTGKTMSRIKEELSLQEPASIRTLVLLVKDRPRDIVEQPDYVLFPIEDAFVIGYGLDYKEYYRGLEGVYVK
jgi:hypoxanthine phosphoribosyltransferase